jgi:predicted  nucleic acid-binding Zn-ribbon protein
MDTNLVGLEHSQEEFHQAFNVHMEDVKEDILVVKNDVDIMKIQMSSVEKDIKDVEMSIDNAHLQLEKVEDQVDGFVNQI